MFVHADGRFTKVEVQDRGEFSHEPHPFPLPGTRVPAGTAEVELMENPLSRSSYHIKALAVVASLALVSGVAGTAAALSLSGMDVDVIGLWQADTDAPDIRMEGHDASVQAKDQVDVTVDLHNTDTANAHEGNVTVQLLDDSGTILVEDTKPTNSMDPDGTLAIDYSFTQSSLAASWAETFAVVDQSS